MKRWGTKERKERIIAILRERWKVAVNELEKDLKVPASTIRRDLRNLVREGLVIRSHGAVELKAASASLLPEPDENVRGPLIDCYTAGAMHLMDEARFLFAGVGTVPEEIVKSLRNREIITNSLAVAIAAAAGNTVTVIGEILDRNTYTLSTRSWMPFLKDRIFQIVILEAEGFDEHSFYASEQQFWLVKEILQQSRKTVLICRDGRFGKPNSRRLEFKGNVHTVLTDKEDLQEKVRGRQPWEGVEVIDVHAYAPKVEPQVPEDSDDSGTDDEEELGYPRGRDLAHGQASPEGTLEDKKKVVKMSSFQTRRAGQKTNPNSRHYQPQTPSKG